MKKRLIIFITPLLAACLETLILFPLLFTLYLGIMRSIPLIVFAAFLAAAYLLGAGFRRLFIRRNRLISLGIGLLMGISASVLLNNFFPQSDTWAKVLFGLLVALAAGRGVIVSERALIDSFPKVYSYMSLALYFLSYFFYGKVITVQEYQRYILIAGLITIPVVFLLSNSEILIQASQEELKESSSMPVTKKNNRVIVIITILIAAFIAGFKTLEKGLLTALKAAGRFILYLIELLSRTKESPGLEQEPSGGGALELPPAEAKEPSPFWDAVVQVVGTVILAAALLFAVYFLIKQLIRLCRFLVKKIKELVEGGKWSDGMGLKYDDEKENLLDWQVIRQNYSDSFRNWWEKIRNTEPKWNQLTDNRQRVRFLYRKLVLQAIASGYSFRNSFTAKETINDLTRQERLEPEIGSMLGKLYDKARYSTETLQDTQVETLKDQILN